MVDQQKTERLQTLMDPEMVGEIDEWRRKQGRIPSRSEAVRLLVREALDQEKKKSK